MHGSLLSFFVGLPWWQSLLIFSALKLAIPTGRLILEGKFYDIALSSTVGESALFIVALIGLDSAKSGLTPLWYTPEAERNILILCLGVCFVVSMLTIGKREGKLMDVYHDLVVAPLLLYFAVDLFPVIAKTESFGKIGFSFFFIMMWAYCVNFDQFYGRLNQRQWLRDHGVALK